MATKAGVWIDHKQAVVILLEGAGKEVKKIKSDIAKPRRASGRSKSSTPYTKNDYLAEDRREHKIEDHRKKYYDEVIDCLRGSDSLLILGPGPAKGELRKRMTSQKLRIGIVELETTDKLSDRQVAAKVVEHFDPAKATKVAAPKRASKKNASTARAGQRKSNSNTGR